MIQKSYKLFCYCCRVKLERDVYTSQPMCDACHVPGHTHTVCTHCNRQVKLNEIVRSASHDLGCVHCYQRR